MVGKDKDSFQPINAVRDDLFDGPLNFDSVERFADLFLDPNPFFDSNGREKRVLIGVDEFSDVVDAINDRR